MIMVIKKWFVAVIKSQNVICYININCFFKGTNQGENMDIKSPLSVIVIYFSLLQFNFQTYAKTNSAEVKCNRKCIKQKIECSTNCRKEGYAINKPETMWCLRDCKLGHQSCENKCKCLALCSRERQGCDQICRRYPFQNQHDKYECFEECIHDCDQCLDVCNNGKMQFPV